MKNAIIAVLVSAALLSGCAIAMPHHETGAKTAQSSQVEQQAAPGVADPLHAIKLVGNDYVKGKDKPLSVKIGNGYTKAMINDEPAKIKRKNATFYEITGQGYIVGVYLDANGFMSASWGKPHSKINGGLNVVKGDGK